MAGFKHINILGSSLLGVIYLYGNSYTDNSVRLYYNDNNMIIIEKRVEGLWQPASFETGPNSLWVGKNVGVAGIGHHLATEASDGHLHFHAHSEFSNDITSTDTQVLNAYLYIPDYPFQPDDSGEWIGTTFEFIRVATLHSLVKASSFRTGDVAANSPIRLRVWKGTDDTGALIFDHTHPPHDFIANSELKVQLPGYLEFNKGESYFFRYNSDELFSLKTDSEGNEPWFSTDISLAREENLLQTQAYEDGEIYTEGDYLIDSRKIYVCNTTGVQNGTFENNSDKWDLIGTHASMSGVDIFTESSIPFADADGKLTEDNVNLRFDDKFHIGVPTVLEDNLISKQSDGIYVGKTEISESHWNSHPIVNKWESRDSVRDWNDIATASNGQYMTASTVSGKLYTSDDYGEIWVARDSDRSWRKVSMSSGGQYQAAVVFGGLIYISSNFGVTWSPEDSVRNWMSVGVSGSGQYMTAGTNGGDIYVSSDYGDIWTLKSKVGNMKSVAISSTGQYQAVAAQNEGVYVSSNYGSTFAKKATVWGWVGVDMSDNGQYMTAVAIKPNGRIYRSTNYGVNWAQVDDGIARDYAGVSMSSDGQYQTVLEQESGDIYISVNYGNFWAKQDNAKDWAGIALTSNAAIQIGVADSDYIFVYRTNFMTLTQSLGSDAWHQVAISGDGQYQTAVGQGIIIYISSDYGKTWIEKESSRNWFGIAMSSDGKYQTATALYDDIYVSSDYGVTWAGISAGSFSWTNVVMSSDGKFQVAICGGQGSAEYVYISYDYGQTWNQKGESNNWQRVTCSSDGKYISVTDNNDKIYRSGDYGETWSRVSYIRNWLGITMSDNGKYQTAVNNDDDRQIYVSSDYGATFSIKGDKGEYIGASMSSSGKYQIVARNTYKSGGGEYSLYISEDYGQTWDILYNTNLSEWADIKMSSDGKYLIMANTGRGIYTYCFDAVIEGNVIVKGNIDAKGLNIIGTVGVEGLLTVTGNIGCSGTIDGGAIQVSGAPVLTSESDPVFIAWDKSTGISIIESQINDLQSYLLTETDPVFLSQKGANNGVATLDSGGKIPASQLPSSVMDYKGSWDASTNTPTLADGIGNAGDVYICSVDGTQDLGSGSISFVADDWVIYNGTIWEQSINSDKVISVNSQTGVVVLDLDDIGDGITYGRPTLAQITNWDTAYNWGDHPAETDPIFTAWDKSMADLSGLSQYKIPYGNASGGLTGSDNLTYSGEALRIGNGGVYLDRSGADSYLVFKRSGSEVGQIRGADGSIDITESGGTPVHLSVDVVSGITTMTSVDTSKIGNSGGILKLNPDATGIVELFGDADVDNSENGRMLYVWRRAPEGDDYLRFYITDNRVGIVSAPLDLTVYAGESITLQSAGENVIFRMGDDVGTKGTYFKNNSNAIVGSVDSLGNAQFNASIDVPEISNTAGLLKIQPDAQGDVEVFGDTDVGNEENSKIFKVWRRASEGNDYIRFYISANRKAFIHASNELTLQAQQPFTINSVTDDITFKVGDNAGAKKFYFKDSDNADLVTIDSDGKTWFGGNVEMLGTLKIMNLPTSDPSDTGALWNDSGAVKVSA